MVPKGLAISICTDIWMVAGRHHHGEREPRSKDLMCITKYTLLIGKDHENFQFSDAQHILYRAA